MLANCEINNTHKGMFVLLIAFCSVSVGRVVAELLNSVRALMVFAQSMQFSDNIFAVNLHKEKMMHVVQNCGARMRKRAGYYLSNREEVDIYQTPVVGGRLSLVAEYQWFTLCEQKVQCQHTSQASLRQVSLQITAITTQNLLWFPSISMTSTHSITL